MVRRKVYLTNFLDGKMDFRQAGLFHWTLDALAIRNDFEKANTRASTAHQTD
jgi:hypothetical protein